MWLSIPTAWEYVIDHIADDALDVFAAHVRLQRILFNRLLAEWGYQHVDQHLTILAIGEGGYQSGA